MARSSATRKAAEQQFIARGDGDWDYFPLGLGRPGLRVDSRAREPLQRYRRRAMTVAGATVIGAFAIADFGGAVLAHRFPIIAPYARSEFITIYAGGILAMILLLPAGLLMWWRGPRALMRGKTRIPPALSREEARASDLERAVFPLGKSWPVQWLSSLSLLMMPIVFVSSISHAMVQFRLHTTVSFVEGLTHLLICLLAGWICFRQARYFAARWKLTRPAS